MHALFIALLVAVLRYINNILIDVKCLNKLNSILFMQQTNFSCVPVFWKTLPPWQSKVIFYLKVARPRNSS